MGELSAFDINNFSKYNPKIYIETGTGEAVSLKHAMKYKQFEKIYSIDIDGDLVESAKYLERIDSRVNLIHNYSVEALEVLVPTIEKDKRVLFYLDAHFPGADFHKVTYAESIREFKESSMPLKEELEILLKYRNGLNDLIIIDDLSLYEEGNYECAKPLQFKELQEEVGLRIDCNFVYEMFNDYVITKDYRQQGYLILLPKN